MKSRKSSEDSRTIYKPSLYATNDKQLKGFHYERWTYIPNKSTEFVLVSDDKISRSK